VLFFVENEVPRVWAHSSMMKQKAATVQIAEAKQQQIKAKQHEDDFLFIYK